MEILRKRYFDPGSEQSRLRLDGPPRKKVNYGTVASLLKAVCCFLQLSQGLKLGNRSFEKLLLNSPGLLESISSSFESLERLELSV